MAIKRYKPVADNEWVQLTPEGYRMACCDCGLVHDLDFRISDEWGIDQRIQLRARRNNRATAALRRNRAHPCKPSSKPAPTIPE